MPKVLVFLILALPLVGAYAMYAIGVVAIYQSSRVLNLAHGALATLPAYLVYTMVVLWGWPKPAAILLGVASGALLGIMVERVFVRRLRHISATAQTVGTVAAFGLMVSIAAKVWGTAGLRGVAVFPEGSIEVGSSSLRFGQIGLFSVSVVLTIALYMLLQKTWFGLAMRGAAQNRRAASYMGIDPDRTTSAAWALGGGLAAISGILLSAVTVLHPYSLSLSVLPAFVAALIGGLEKLPAALAGSAVVGLVIGLVPVLAEVPFLEPILGQLGGAELALTFTAMLVMALRGQKFASVDVRAESLAASGTGDPSMKLRFKVKPFPRLALAALVLWIWIPGLETSYVADASRALLYTIVAASLVLLAGWVGQISLAQAAFVGVGAFGSVLLANRFGIEFPFSLPLAGALTAAVAVLLGMVALRVRGLYLAVGTLIFGWMADQYLFSAPWFAGAGGSATMDVKPIGFEGGFPFFDFERRQIFYLVALAGAALTLFALGNLRRSKTGRAFFAIRGSEMAAASLGIDVTRYKLLAFGISGFIAGIAGNLIATQQRTIVPAAFGFTVSLFYLSVVVVGGLQSLGGAIGAAIVFAALNQLFFKVEALQGWLDVVSAALLVIVLLFYPGGLSALPSTLARHLTALEPAIRWVSALMAEVREAVRPVTQLVSEVSVKARSIIETTIAKLVPRRMSKAEVSASEPLSSPALAGGDGPPPRDGFFLPADRNARQPVLDVEGVTVKFGGLIAVSEASISVRKQEIVGLIGPNGAGKTTLFNATAGFVTPASGKIKLNGQDVTSLGVHERAAKGIGRTFQLIQLFPQLTVRENLLVATHTRNSTGFLSHLVITKRSVAAEQEARDKVADIVNLLGIEEVSDRLAAGLPFGTLRIVELARALVSGAPLVMLDEAASGLDNNETGVFTERLRGLREGLGLSLLVIEHDVGMVMSLCDYIYVLDRGKMICEGPPAVVKDDPAVIAAYLGDADESEPAVVAG